MTTRDGSGEMLVSRRWVLVNLTRATVGAAGLFFLPSGISEGRAVTISSPRGQAPTSTPGRGGPFEGLLHSGFLGDESGSINDSDPRGFMVSISRMLVELVRPGRIVLGGFSGNYPSINDWEKIPATASLDLSNSTDYKTALSFVDRLREKSNQRGFEGNTPFAAAVKRMFMRFDEAQAGKGSPIYVATDGVATPLTARQYDELEAFFAERTAQGKIVYPLALAALLQTDDVEAQQFKPRLQRIAEMSGGQFREVSTAEQLLQAVIGLVETFGAVPKGLRDEKTVGGSGVVQFETSLDGTEKQLYVLVLPEDEAEEVAFTWPTALPTTRVDDRNLVLLSARAPAGSFLPVSKVGILIRAPAGKKVSVAVWRESSMTVRLLEPALGGALPIGQSSRFAIGLGPKGAQPIPVPHSRAEVIVRKQSTGEKMQTRTLLDDGLEGDLKSGDGVLARMIAFPSTPERWEVAITAYVDERPLPAIVQTFETIVFPALSVMAPEGIPTQAVPVGTTLDLCIARWLLDGKPASPELLEAVEVQLSRSDGLSLPVQKIDPKTIDVEGKAHTPLPLPDDHFRDLRSGSEHEYTYRVQVAAQATYRGTPYSSVAQTNVTVRVVRQPSLVEAALQTVGRYRVELASGAGLTALLSWVGRAAALRSVAVDAVPASIGDSSLPVRLKKRPSLWSRLVRRPGNPAWTRASKLAVGIQLGIDHQRRLWIRALGKGHTLNGKPLTGQKRQLNDGDFLRLASGKLMTIRLPRFRPSSAQGAGPKTSR